MTASFTMSRHGLIRALDMALEGTEIRDAFERPRRTYYSPESRSTWNTRGRVTVCWRQGQGDPLPVITTVVWATANAWTNDDQYAPIRGREDKTVAMVRTVARARKRSA
jgi:hypothetical protein